MKPFRRHSLSTTCLGALALGMAPSLAAETVGSLSLSTAVQVLSSASLDDDGADAEFDGTQFGVGGRVQAVTDRRYVFGASFNGFIREVEWEGAGIELVDLDGTPAVVAVPFDRIESATFGLDTRVQLNQRYGVFGGLNVNMTKGVDGFYDQDGDSDFDDSQFLGGMAGVSYVFNPELIVSVGVAVSEQFADSTRVLPLLMVRWQATEELLVETRNGILLTYDLSEEIDFQFSALWQSETVTIGELASGDVIGFEDQGFILGASMDYFVNDWLTVTPNLGFSFGREWEFRAADREITSYDVDGSLLGGLTLTASW